MSTKLPYIIRRPDLDTWYQFKCTALYVIIFLGIVWVLS